MAFAWWPQIFWKMLLVAAWAERLSNLSYLQKSWIEFLNVFAGYSKHHNVCHYKDPNLGKKLSSAYHQHESSDLNFKQRTIAKRLETNIKNGHDANWNNAKKALSTKNANDPNWRHHANEKRKQTKKKWYGDPNWNNTKKAQETCLDRYGVNSYSKTDEFLEKMKASNKRKFGVYFAM